MSTSGGSRLPKMPLAVHGCGVGHFPIPMKFNRTLKYASTVLWVLLWLFMGFPTAQGARIAGEEDVTPSRPLPIQQRIRPNQRTLPSRRPVPRTTVQSEEKTDSKGAATGEKKSPNNQTTDARFVTIDFDNVDIQIFIKFISELTGKNFVVDKAVKGKVTIISPTKISVDEAYTVFE
jgi:general secretion pathway protein D